MANRLLTINVRKYLSKQPRRKRHMKLPKYVKYKVAQATNVRSSNIKISKELNSIMLKRYLHSMEPMKININIEKDMATITHFDSKPTTTTQAAKKDEGKGKTKQAAPVASQPAKGNESSKKTKEATEPKQEEGAPKATESKGKKNGKN